MAHAWQVFLHYFLIVAPWLVAAGIPSLITALTAYPKADGFVKVLKVVLNMLSVLTHADSPGTLKMPLSMSPAPSTAIELPPPVRPGMFLPFLLLGALAASGCATAGGAALGRCELGALPQTLETVIAQVAAIVASPGDYVADLENLGKGLAPNQLSCVEQAIAAALNPADPTQKAMHERLTTHMKMHPGHACRSLPPARVHGLLSAGEPAFVPITGDGSLVIQNAVGAWRPCGYDPDALCYVTH